MQDMAPGKFEIWMVYWTDGTANANGSCGPRYLEQQEVFGNIPQMIAPNPQIREYQTPPSYNFHKLFLTEFKQLRRKPMKLQHSLIGTSGDKLSPFVQEYSRTHT
jgi:hypothetical protein